MADQIRVTRDEENAAHVHRSEIAEHADVEATIPAHPGRSPVVPDDPEAARAEIQMTRARMSETIDEIEDVLLRKKEKIQDRLDIFSTVRQRPMQSVGAALGAGILMGILTGGDDDEEDYDEHDHPVLRRAAMGAATTAATGAAASYAGSHLHDDRADTWEHRARRLLAIAREQEEEIDRLSHGRSAARARAEHAEAEAESSHDESGSGGTLDQIRDRILGMLSGYVSTAVHQMVREQLPSAKR